MKMARLCGPDGDSELSKEEKKYYKDMEGKWRAEDDVRCMMNYQELKRDPKRYKAAMYCLRQKKKDMDKAVKEMNNDNDYKEGDE